MEGPTAPGSFVEDYPFSTELFLHLSQISWGYLCGSIYGFFILFHWPMCLSRSKYVHGPDYFSYY